MLKVIRVSYRAEFVAGIQLTYLTKRSSAHNGSQLCDQSMLYGHLLITGERLTTKTGP
jgi:hypothetical protein